MVVLPFRIAFSFGKNATQEGILACFCNCDKITTNKKTAMETIYINRL